MQKVCFGKENIFGNLKYTNVGYSLCDLGFVSLCSQKEVIAWMRRYYMKSLKSKTFLSTWCIIWSEYAYISEKKPSL